MFKYKIRKTLKTFLIKRKQTFIQSSNLAITYNIGVSSLDVKLATFWAWALTVTTTTTEVSICKITECFKRCKNYQRTGKFCNLCSHWIQAWRSNNWNTDAVPEDSNITIISCRQLVNTASFWFPVSFWNLLATFWFLASLSHWLASFWILPVWLVLAFSPWELLVMCAVRDSKPNRHLNWSHDDRCSAGSRWRIYRKK